MFSVDVEILTRAMVLKLRGDLDFDSVAQFHEVRDVVTARRPSPELVVVDCSALGFCDSSGIGAFAELYSILSRWGGELCLISVPDTVGRVLSQTGLDQAMTVRADLGEALASLPGHDKVGGERADTVAGEGRGE